MPTPGHLPLTPRDLVEVLFRHKGKMLLWSGLLGVLAIGALAALPRKYQSEAKLFVRLGRESVTLDPTATTGTTVQVQESRESQINSTRDMLKSRALLERVVEKLGPDVILKGQRKTREASIFSRGMDALSSGSIFRPVSDSEKAVDKLEKSLSIASARNSSVIDVGCTAKSPYLARQIMRVFLKAYQTQHLAANRTAGSLEFFTTQAAQLKRELDAAVEKLRDAKTESKIVAISVEQQALQNQLTQVEAAALAADAALSSTKGTIESLRKALQSCQSNSRRSRQPVSRTWASTTCGRSCISCRFPCARYSCSSETIILSSRERGSKCGNPRRSSTASRPTARRRPPQSTARG